MPLYDLAVDVTAVQTIDNVTTINGVVAGSPIARAPANPAGSNSPAANQGFQLIVRSDIGGTTVSASAQPVVSNDGIHWTDLGSAIEAPDATNSSSAIGANSNAPYGYFGAYITAISGDGAKATVIMCA